ncbi:hypothetical protein O3P69_012131 [Scylla paramamosain]|uniref:Uncharacterized protein n=1 Tax=Scylla paramamosain TaxID=85552 RepID=A0AAW0TEZ4_SCYPA
MRESSQGQGSLVRGPVAWRAEVTLGCGLTFFQDVFVSVQDGGGGGDGGGGENGAPHPRPPAPARPAPTPPLVARTSPQPP